jgi:regulator of sigma E protease
MNLLHTLLAFIVALGVLVAFHEFGHYLAARLCGVKVLRYCLGFGTPVVSRRWGRDQTEWAIAAFPLGGYVKLLGQDPDEVVPEPERHRSFLAQSVGKRMWIIVAGPLANLLLAVALYWGLNLHGIEEPVARIAVPVSGSVAERAQLQPGDTITRSDGSEVRAWGDLSWNLLRAAHDRRNIKLEVQRPGNQVAFVELDLSALTDADLDGDTVGKLGFRLFRPSPRVVAVETGSPAQRGGIALGDVLLKVDGRRVTGGDDFVRIMRANPGRELVVELDRAATIVTVVVRPDRLEREGQVFGRIGAGIDDRPALVRVSYGAGEGLTKAVGHTWEMSVFSLKMLGRMLVGEVSWRNLSGPVTIADYAGKTARLGATYYLNFIALVSISLGVLNLLPIPVLDGGYLLYYSIEAVRSKPVPAAWMEFGTKFGLAIVIVAMSLALFNDISRLLAG